MKYFIDTEFHEYHKQHKVAGIKVGKPIPTIDLISIGIASEDIETINLNIVKDHILTKDIKNSNIGSYEKQYYAVCKEFDLKDAWEHTWLKSNVLYNIAFELTTQEYTEAGWDLDELERFEEVWNESDAKAFKEMKRLVNDYGKTKKEIAEEVIEFTQQKAHTIKTGYEVDLIEFFGYYADYDWVVFCQMFGNMLNLPEGFPMYCRDLKQLMDELVYSIKERGETFEQGLKWIKSQAKYPKQENEHNALDDALWNKDLYKFLKQL